MSAIGDLLQIQNQADQHGRSWLKVSHVDTLDGPVDGLAKYDLCPESAGVIGVDAAVLRGQILTWMQTIVSARAARHGENQHAGG